MTPKVGDFYCHYRNQKMYQLLHIGYIQETLEPCVIYQAQYDTEDLGEKPIFVRPLKEFCEEVEVEERMVLRFQKIIV